MSWLRSGREEAAASPPGLQSPGGNPQGLEEAANQAGGGCQEGNPGNRVWKTLNSIMPDMDDIFMP